MYSSLPSALRPFRSSSVLSLESLSNHIERDSLYGTQIEDFKKGLIVTGAGEISLKFQTLNMDTTKMLFDLFKFVRDKGCYLGPVKVCWEINISNVEMLETAMDYAEIFDVDIRIKMT